MKDILFCKNLHDHLKNKGDKPVATKDEEWIKMNRKTIGLIRQCIGHEVFHHVTQETSAYELWIKLEEAKTSRNKALLMRRLMNLKFQRETTVAEHTTPNGKLTTSMVMDALFNEETRRREMVSTDQSESQALVSEENRERSRSQGRGHHKGTEKGRWRSQTRGRTVRCFYCHQEEHIKRDCPKHKAQDQSSDTTATAVMADDDEIDHARDVYGWQTTQLAELLAEDQSGSAWQTGALTLVEGTLRVFKENKEMLWGKKTIGLYRLEGSVQTGELLSDMGPVVLARRVDKGSNRCTEVRKASAWVLEGSKMDVQREAQRKEIKSILRSCTAKGAMMPKRVSFALDLISGGDLSSCAHKRRRDGAMTTRKMTYFAAHPVEGVRHPSGGFLMGELDQKAVRKDNLKTSDYPPEKIEKKKAEYAEKMNNKKAEIRKAAEEKKAVIESNRGEDILKVEEIAAKFSATGNTPKRLFG
ncbi:remorin family protein [Actinidia rufa]|uniref:Remorin family protein n=1 Tax=Actinidia rufa TaxID=165716 RepID=A0A7J0DKG2_9ERIC|nr:remorin family protein [Actinidia rufa]